MKTIKQLREQYLDYVNNYLTAGCQAEHLEMSEQDLVQQHKIGRRYQEMYAALYKLQCQAKQGALAKEVTGICHNWQDLFDGIGCYRFVSENASDWEHFSGWPEWPVPGRGFPWQGEQLKLRLSLIDHLMSKFE